MPDFALVLHTAPPQGSNPDGAALTKIDSRESALRALDVFANRDSIGQTFLVIDKSEEEQVKQRLGNHLGFVGVKVVVSNAMLREQLADAAKLIGPHVTHVILHDAARPAVPFGDVDALFYAAEKHPAVALVAVVRGPLADARTVPGKGKLSFDKAFQLLSPIAFDRATFERVAGAGTLAGEYHLIEGSPLNVRCGWHDAGFVKTMVNALPKPKAKALLNPFEEAQW